MLYKKKKYKVYLVYYLRVRGSRLLFITLRTGSSVLWVPLVLCDDAKTNPALFPLLFPMPLLPRIFNLGSREASTLDVKFAWEFVPSGLL